MPDSAEMPAPVRTKMDFMAGELTQRPEIWPENPGCLRLPVIGRAVSLYKGLVSDMTKNFKHLRKTRHTHHPVDDAKGNAEAMLAMRDEMGLKIRL